MDVLVRPSNRQRRQLNKRVVAIARTVEPEKSLGRTDPASLNRLVRTRMPGGVGKVPGNGHPYAIYVLMFSLWRHAKSFNCSGLISCCRAHSVLQRN